MKKITQLITVAATTLLGLVVTAAILTPAAPSAAAAPSLQINQGKTFAMQVCAKCHGANFMGHPHRTPNITVNGEMKHYTKSLFERLMSTGVENNGRMVHPPMRVFHYPAPKADAIYAYLKSI